MSGYIKNTRENSERIAKIGKEERDAQTNPLQLKLREKIQTDEYTKINKYSEGVCWGCMRKDYVLSSLWDACGKCIEKRGVECMMAKTTTKLSEELCDFCGSWEGGAKGNFVSQINISLCRSCQAKVNTLHTQYQNTGGRKGNHPFFKYLEKKHGKDWEIIMSDGIIRRKF